MVTYNINIWCRLLSNNNTMVPTKADNQSYLLLNGTIKSAMMVSGMSVWNLLILKQLLPNNVNDGRTVECEITEITTEPHTLWFIS